MRVLWIFAHPEARSLSGALRDAGLRALTDLGHEHRSSDLYAMKWKPTVDADDFTAHQPDQPLVVTRASQRAHQTGTLSADIRAEQDKLGWADAVVLQFPLWWAGMPAILKGWFDRVFVKGFAYGVTDPRNRGRTLRYGEGRLAGKRALTVVTAGSPEAPLGPRGINGQLDQLLFPLLHGTLWYAGMTVLSPLVVHGADRVGPGDYDAAVARLRSRVSSLEHERPMPYRRQNGGDYDADLVLCPDVAPGTTGLAAHLAGP
jgi:NAD(P)H dehydrogenase (quinone)